MTSIAKNAYIAKLDDIVKKCNNAYHKTIEMEPRDVKPSIYIDFSKEINKEGPKLKIVIMLEYQIKKIFLKIVTVYIVLKEILCLKQLKILYHRHIILVITFYEKQLKERNKKKFRVEKVIKRKRYNSNVKQERYNNSFKTGIDKKDIV